MQGWDEETWQALYQAAQLVERLGRPPAEIERAYLEVLQRASDACRAARATRAMAPAAQRVCARVLFARAAVALPRPADQLFVEDAVYAWRALDELAIAAWHAGFRSEGRAAAQRLLDESVFPPSERPRMEQNYKWYEPA